MTVVDLSECVSLFMPQCLCCSRGYFHCWVLQECDGVKHTHLSFPPSLSLSSKPVGLVCHFALSLFVSVFL